MEPVMPSDFAQFVGEEIIGSHVMPDMRTVRFKKVMDTAVAPRVSQPGDVAADLCAAEDRLIPARGRALVATGICVELPLGFRASLRSRSGLSLKYGIETGAGLIDASYRDPIGVLLYNHSDQDYQVRTGDRISQICVEKFTFPNFMEVAELSPTGRSAGWGSSGK